MHKQNNLWISSPLIDSLFILSPAFISVCIAFFFSHHAWTPWIWLIVIVGVDVSHVWSTLYKTYFDSQELAKRPYFYRILPIAVWITGTLLYSLSSLYFWRIAAYMALFHFIRQQYGFMMLYIAKEKPAFILIKTRKFMIYFASLCPIIYWHLYPRNFHWFIKEDFFTLHSPIPKLLFFIAYLSMIALWLSVEIIHVTKNRTCNWGAVTIIAGTLLSWGVGIMIYNNDLVFTLTNVLSHGIPYMALIFIYNKQSHTPQKPKWKQSLILFLVIIFSLGYLEETLWDHLVWHEHPQFFSWLKLPPPELSLLPLIVPLLAVPQLTHYIIDGVIWKTNKESKILF